MNEPQLTFALCAYKESPFLEEALQSLKNQTIAVRILAATSTPCSYIENLAKKYGADYFVNPVAGGGIAADWEFAASCAGTKYVTIAHQDDIYFPEYARRVLKAFEQEPESVIVFTDYSDLVGKKLLHDRGYLRIKRLLLWAYYLKSSWKSKFFKRLALCFGNAICCPSVTYNREKTFPIHFDRSFSVNLDWAKWLELSEIPGAFTYIRQASMAHRIDETTETSAAIQDNRRYNEDLRLFTSLWGEKIAGFLMRFYALAYKPAENGKK